MNGKRGRHIYPASSTLGKIGEVDVWAGILDLRAAIIHRACVDYLQALQGRESMHSSSHGPIDQIERFFRSRWFSTLCDLDGEMLLLGIREYSKTGKKTIPVGDYSVIERRNERDEQKNRTRVGSGPRKVSARSAGD